jgi:hypothetical protein
MSYNRAAAPIPDDPRVMTAAGESGCARGPRGAPFTLPSLPTMAGQLKQMCERLIQERSKGSATLVVTTRTKLLLKGIPVNDFSDSSPDDPAMMQRLREAAGEMGVHL